MIKYDNYWIDLKQISCVEPIPGGVRIHLKEDSNVVCLSGEAAIQIQNDIENWMHRIDQARNSYAEIESKSLEEVYGSEWWKNKKV